MPGELTVQDHTGKRRTLERCEVNDSNDQPTLGVRLMMSGDLWDQIHYLGEQAEIFCESTYAYHSQADGRAVHISIVFHENDGVSADSSYHFRITVE
jgi:hypothetical protein